MTELSDNGQKYLRMLKTARAAEARQMREGSKTDRVQADLSDLIGNLFAEWMVGTLDVTMGGDMPEGERNEVVSNMVSALLNTVGWMILNAGAAVEDDKFARATLIGSMMAHLQMSVADGLTNPEKYTPLADAAGKGMQ